MGEGTAVGVDFASEGGNVAGNGGNVGENSGCVTLLEGSGAGERAEGEREDGGELHPNGCDRVCIGS